MNIVHQFRVFLDDIGMREVFKQEFSIVLDVSFLKALRDGSFIRRIECVNHARRNLAVSDAIQRVQNGSIDFVIQRSEHEGVGGKVFHDKVG